ncbi:hypothetical protein [Rhizobium phage RHph_X66]|nr:hypothetical protein [Rhizobium phage RHph_X66]
MGQMKRMMEEFEAVVDEAEEIGISAGWLERCGRHEELTVRDSTEKGHAYALANWRVKHKKTFTAAEDLKDALDRLAGDTGYMCSWCRRDADRDD